MSRDSSMPMPVEVFAVQRRRRFSAEEKQRLVHETYQPGMTVSLVARAHRVSPSLLFRRRRLASEGSLSAVSADEEVVPASEVQALQRQIRELQRLLGKKTQENEILREAMEAFPQKKVTRALVVIRGGRHPAAAVCRVLGVSRSNLLQRRSGRGLSDRRGRAPIADPQLAADLRELASQRPTYGYRRLWALLNRQRRRSMLPPVNAKRVYRLARSEKLLLQRYTGTANLRVHEGRIAVERSDVRYCSDGFDIRCDNGECVRVTFSLDCCDRQAIAFAGTTAGISGELVRDIMVQTIENRFGDAPELPYPAEWLSDNGSGYIARETRRFAQDLGFKRCRTPYRSPQSNGMAEAFVKTFKRDYVKVNPRPDAQTVLESLPAWFADYNEVHPHRQLAYHSPNEFRDASLSPAICPGS